MSAEDRLARKGDYVEVTSVILPAGERAPSVPPETAKVPYVLRQKGFLVSDEARIGDKVQVTTVIGRAAEGELMAINPPYQHTFGRPVPELLRVGDEAKRIIEEAERRG